MELLPLLCLCVVTRSGITFADENGPVVVREDSDVILNCSLSTKENIESKLFDWKKEAHKEVFLYDAGRYYGKGFTGQDEQFKGRVSHFPEELKNGNASIMIRKTKVADSGNYTCIFPRLQPRQEFNIQLVVGAASKPSIAILDETQDHAFLQCEVHGASPKPAVWWQDSSGNILPAEEEQVTERGGSYNIIFQTTVTKTDHYHCVVTQEELNHRTEAQTYVHLSETNKVMIGVLCLIVGLVVGVFVGVFVGCSGKVCRGSSGDKSYQSAEKDPESVNTPDPV